MRSVGPRLSDRLGQASCAELFGREPELEQLCAQLGPSGAVVTFVHGSGGIGKTALLAAAEARLARLGARVLRLDGRTIEPTARGFLAALEQALGAPAFSDAEALAAELERSAAPVVFMLDEFDRLRLLDDWLRHALLPALPERTRWVFAGRFAPRSAWLTTPGWSDVVLPLRLGALPEPAARAVLARRGVADERMPELLTVARGVPLALTLLALPRAPAPAGETRHGVNESAVLAALAQRSVEALGQRLREALEAMSLVRRATRELLEAMLGERCDDGLLAELAELSFVEHAGDGLTLHETVRHALTSRLRALDPARHRQLSLAAWRALERQIEGAAPSGAIAWRLTADLLFMIERPEIREAFYPSRELALDVGPALAADHDTLAAIVQRHERSEWLGVFTAWWRLARSAFRVVRDAQGSVRGFSMVSVAHDSPPELAAFDPLLRAWQAHVASGPARERGALFMRRGLSEAAGERLDDVRSAIWLDIKRAYVERPGQWAVYTATRDIDGLLARVTALGFRRSPLAWAGEGTLELEFGAGGVWGWLRGLVNGAWSSAPVEPERGAPSRIERWALDPAARALRVDGAPRALSTLEYRAFAYLLEREGHVVTRDELLAAVWQQRVTGSNVVDAVIRLLRKKLAPYSHELATVRGHGYRITRSDTTSAPP
jgi:hypothetical protein